MKIIESGYFCLTIPSSDIDFEFDEHGIDIYHGINKP